MVRRWSRRRRGREEILWSRERSKGVGGLEGDLGEGGEGGEEGAGGGGDDLLFFVFRVFFVVGVFVSSSFCKPERSERVSLEWF